MKKITLFSFLLLVFAFSNFTIAQTLNQNANWPNANWTVTGNYSTDPLAFESDPTTTANFAFDDDDAGGSHEDNIAAESPIIDLTTAFNAGEVWLTVSADYVYRYLADDELVFQYWDADGSAWVNWGPSFDTLGTDTAVDDDFCTGISQTYVSPVLDISSFTSTQLAGFRYRISYDDNPAGTDWNWGFCFQSPTIVSATPPTDVLDYYNLQWPPNGNIGIGSPFEVYAQAYEAGLTDVTAGQAPGIEAWIGYSTADTDPSGAGWTWIVANFNAEVGNNDEYSLNLGASISATGTYYYASRWRLNGGFYTYGGIQADGSFGGEWGDNGNGSGVLTVTAPSNDECDNAVALTVNTDLSCGTVTAGTTVAATASPQADDVSGTPNNDVWFSFLATGTAHTVVLTDVVAVVGTSVDMGIGVYDGTGGCASLVFTATSDPNTLNLTGLTAGVTYYVRVYGWGSGAGTAQANFNICVGTPPAPPSNDECDNAVALTVNADLNCGNVTAGTTVSATASPQADDVSGTPNNDVWFSFVATGAEHRVSLSDVVAVVGTSTDMGIGVYDGTGGCASLVFTATSDPNTLNLTGLTSGVTYYVRVYGWASGTGTAQTNFNICVGTPPAPPSNDLCSNAIGLACNQPLNGTTISATGGASTSCVGSIGNDVWYQFTGNDSTVDLTVNSSTAGEGAQVEVYSSTDGTCAGFTLATCFESAGSGENPVLLSFDADSGTEYFIRIGNWINGNPGLDFSITASCTPFPACGEPSNLDAVVAEMSADISWDAPTIGTPIGYNWEVQPDGTPQGTAGAIVGNTANTSDTVNGLTGTTAYDLYVQTDCDADGTSEWVGPYSFTTTGPPPANDLFANAIALNCGDDVTGTTIDATQDESDAPSVATIEDDTFADNDSPWVWYSYTGSGVSEEITLSTCGTAQTDFDTEIFVYTGTSGNLTLVDDGYDECGGSAENWAAETTFTSDGTTTYYIAVGGYDSDDVGNFHLAVTCVTLSVDELENPNSFTYFPNPVNDELNLKAQSNIQNVSIYNMLGQEVLRTAPNSLESNVDMSQLQEGAYFVKVTINNATETVRVIKQ
ncbi:T9SS type A sorting domain-containing protein [Subsaxibacter sp. CAU 1640]|uniref:T9SS type A sorting domain-containing protein n=1 Tax=Subsaxibacter sp. CAU 1640 TaxID=2933271 RepID=UPI002006A7CF|nr:T9SS type A sorting domain-containing protein [Subsaxibacter sp. CAU 1640]MCK7590831.1 T9SS type A sorting domain-containing protein [Subsaxibacter sp. CAU 1640]